LTRRKRLFICSESVSYRYVDRDLAALCGLPAQNGDSRARRYPFAPCRASLHQPAAAQLMLTHYPSAGKRVLLTAGSDCAILLGQWARRLGAETVYGIHRSAVHADRLAAMGIIPIAQNETATIGPSPHSQTGFTMPRGASGRRDPECHARRGRFCLLWAAFRPAVPPTARSSAGNGSTSAIIWMR
jgi:hypothetical protein